MDVRVHLCLEVKPFLFPGCFEPFCPQGDHFFPFHPFCLASHNCPRVRYSSHRLGSPSIHPSTLTGDIFSFPGSCRERRLSRYPLLEVPCRASPSARTWSALQKIRPPLLGLLIGVRVSHPLHVRPRLRPSWNIPKHVRRRPGIQFPPARRYYAWDVLQVFPGPPVERVPRGSRSKRSRDPVSPRCPRRCFRSGLYRLRSATFPSRR